MKRIVMIMLALLASLSFAGGPLAAGMESGQEKMGTMGTMHESLGAMTGHEEMGNVVSANRLIGLDVKNQKGEIIGEVQDLMLDRASGRIGYVVLSKGAVLGVGEERYAVPFGAFKAGPETSFLVLTIDEKKLANAPRMEQGMDATEYGRRINEYYGQAPFWEGTGDLERRMTPEQPMEKMQKEEMKGY